MRSEAITGNRLICELKEEPINLFFSLADYRNSYFTSNDQNKIMEFYEGVQDSEELIEWMRERPKGVSYVHEVEGDKEIVVVITTADFDGKYAKECRDNIFKGLHLIFVESGGRGDFYFNIAHNINVGIKKAMEYNPRWVVFSNDDMVKQDEISVLQEALKNYDPSKTGIAYFYPSTSYHSREMNISTIRKTRSIVNPLLLYSRRKAFDILKKFNTKFVLSGGSIRDLLFYKRVLTFRNTIAIAVYSAEMIKEFISRYGCFFDETYINSGEDGDLALRVQKAGWEKGEVNFRIRPLIGGTFGNSDSRYLRDQAGNIYFSKKREEEEHDF